MDTSVESPNSEDESINISTLNPNLEKFNSNSENSQTNIQENPEDATFTTVIRKKRKHVESKPYKPTNKENQYDELGQKTWNNFKN